MVEVAEKTAPIPVVKTLDEISISGSGRRDYLPSLDVPEAVIPEGTKLILRKEPIGLSDVPESEVFRHFEALADLNLSISSAFYPLGSCTMKYNPPDQEKYVQDRRVALTHPLQVDRSVQGNLRMYHELQGYLAEITGFDDATLNPRAGSHGEWTGLLMGRRFHRHNGEDSVRRKVLVPDSAHGSNPASASMAGYTVEAVATNSRGTIDMEDFKRKLGGDVATMMVTIPNTLGLFEDDIMEVAYLLHQAGALLQGDGANLNALLGLLQPRKLGFDLMHLNLHKSFSTPHGGGGPGAGPVVVTDALCPFLPDPHVEIVDGKYRRVRPENSIGRVDDYNGSFDVLVRAYAYIRANGEKGLRRVSEDAILNANYLRVRLGQAFQVAYDRPTMHEVVFSAAKQLKLGVHTVDICKALEDRGIHPFTMYFPLIVPEAMMIEPTETETLANLDAFVEAMLEIASTAEENPEMLKNAPIKTPVGRLDETAPARALNAKAIVVARSQANPFRLAHTAPSASRRQQ